MDEYETLKPPDVGLQIPAGLHSEVSAVDGDENPRIDGAVMSFSGPAALFEHRSPG